MSIAQPRRRPELDLGPMTGPPEYIEARAENLVRAYAGLLDVDEIKLINASLTGEGGKTDCFSTIWAPLEDPEGLLVVEHELSHWLFETDVVMTGRFVQKLASKMLNAVNIVMGTDQALPYEKHLSGIIHHLWNILEDWRCCWLWTQLYLGGGTLLQERWHGIAQYDIPEDAVKGSLLACLGAYAAGVEYADTQPDLEDCKLSMRRALNLVEGVDAVACLAITAKLIDEIADTLLLHNPPPPPPGGGGSGGQNGAQGQGKPSKSQSVAQQRQQQQQQMLQALKNLLASTPRVGKGSPGNAGKDGAMGGATPADPPDKERRKRERSTGKMAQVDRLINLSTTETDGSGTTPFQLVLAQGSDEMDQRLEDARNAMMRRQDGEDEASARTHLGWSQECGIPVHHVTPARDLPPPTAVAYENRRILEQLRMKKRRKKDHEGDFSADAFLSALGAGELDRPFYTKTVRVPRFELLFLFDVSGSMTIGQALALTERALADSVFAVNAIRSKAQMWGFSDALYIFDKIGSPLHTSGIQYGCTCTVQALDVAHKWGAKAPSKRAIMLVTDGWPTSCRPRNSTGNPLTDLHAVLTEIRADKIPLSVLGIRHANTTVADATIQYDTAFGKGGYGMVGDFTELSRELPKATRILASAHIQKGLART